MKHRIIHSLLAMILFGSPEVSISQSNMPGMSPNVEFPSLNKDPQTPTAASIARFGDFPVSYFSGRPDISIPICNLTCRNLSLPVALTYEPSGVMVNNLPGWAGQNWTLDAGGLITRKSNGKLDERISSEVPYFKSYFRNPGMFLYCLNQGDNYRKLKDSLFFYDYAPDEFSFHFMGKSGKFFLDSNGEWRVMSKDNLKVIFDYSHSVTDTVNFKPPFIRNYPVYGLQPKSIFGFKIQDDSGYIYQFGYDVNAIEYTTNFWHMSIMENEIPWYATSWYLTKVTDRFGNIIFELEYERKAYVMQIFFSYYRNYKEGNGIDVVQFFSTNESFPYNISISSPVYLTKIKGGGTIINVGSSYVPDALATDSLYGSFCQRYQWNINTIYEELSKRSAKYYDLLNNQSHPKEYFYYLCANFNPSLQEYRYENGIAKDILGHTRLRKLDYIEIETDTCKKHCFVFKHSYPCHRLRLDGLEWHAGGYASSEDIIGKYAFEYDRFEDLPSDYLTTKTDHWGFYNGINYANISSNSCSVNNSIRNARPDYCKIGTLTKIQYPTGGVTELDYELNSYSRRLSDNRQNMISILGSGGGLRIKSIREYDSINRSNLVKSRDFDYNTPGTSTSSGELFAVPKYQWGLVMPTESGYVSGYSITQTSSIVPLVNSSGASVGYKYVTEKIRDLSNTSAIEKSTIYRYTNLSDTGMRDQLSQPFYNNFPLSPFSEFSSLGFMRGQLLSETTFDREGNKVREMTYDYRNDNFLDQFVYTSNMDLNSISKSGNYVTYTGGVYKIYYPKYDIVKTTEKIFTSGGDSITTVTEYDKTDYCIESGMARLCDSVIKSRVCSGTAVDAQVLNYTYETSNANAIQDFYFPMTRIYETKNGSPVRVQYATYSEIATSNGIHLVPHVISEAYGVANSYTGNGISGYPIVTYNAFNQKGELTRFTETGKAPTTLQYDNWGRVIEKTTGLETTLYNYNLSGQLIDITLPNGLKTRFKYDACGRLVETSDDQGVHQENNYNYLNK